jgi:hypothetical protein
MGVNGNTYMTVDRSSHDCHECGFIAGIHGFVVMLKLAEVHHVAV